MFSVLGTILGDIVPVLPPMTLRESRAVDGSVRVENQSLEHVSMSGLLRPGYGLIPELCLHLLPELYRNNTFMQTFMDFRLLRLFALRER